MKLFVVLASFLMLTTAEYSGEFSSTVGSFQDSLEKSMWRGYLRSALTGLNTGINNYLSSADFQELQRSGIKTAPRPIYTSSSPSLLSYFSHMPKVEGGSFVRKLQDALFQRAVKQSFPTIQVKTPERSPPTSQYGAPNQIQPSLSYGANPANTFGGTFLKEGSIVPSRGIRVRLTPIQPDQPFSSSIRQAPVSRQQIYQSLTNTNSAGSIVRALPLTSFSSAAYTPEVNTYSSAPAAFRSQIVEAYKAPTTPSIKGFEISNAINLIEDGRAQASSQVGVQVSPNYGSPGQLGINQDYSNIQARSKSSQVGVQVSPNYGSPGQLGINQDYSNIQAPSQSSDSYGVPSGGYSGNLGTQGGYQTGEGGGERHVFVHAQAPQPEPPRISAYKPPVAPEVHQQIIFVKAPAPVSQGQTYVELPAQPETKTQVYVLVKTPEQDEDSIKVTRPVATTPSPPEVFFVRYANNASKQPLSDFNKVTSDRTTPQKSFDQYAPQMTHSSFNYKKREVM